MADLVGVVRKPCTCRTGNYCHRHRQYGFTVNQDRQLRSNVPNDEGVCEMFQSCGGGRRIFKRNVSQSD